MVEVLSIDISGEQSHCKVEPKWNWKYSETHCNSRMIPTFRYVTLFTEDVTTILPLGNLLIVSPILHDTVYTWTWNIHTREGTRKRDVSHERNNRRGRRHVGWSRHADDASRPKSSVLSARTSPNSDSYISWGDRVVPRDTRFYCPIKWKCPRCWHAKRREERQGKV